MSIHTHTHTHTHRYIHTHTFEGYFIEYAYWWEFVCDLLESPFSLYPLCYILLSIRDECLRLGTLGHYPLYHLICWWCGFSTCSNLSWSSFISSIHGFIIISIITFDPFYSCHHHILLSHRCTLQASLILSSHHSYTFHYRFNFRYFPFITTKLALDTLRSMVHKILYTYAFLYMRVWVLIFGHLNLVFLHFYYLITLAYVTSYVLRPPWGHGIICHIWQSLLRQEFEVQLIFRCHHAFSFRRRFFNV